MAVTGKLEVSGGAFSAAVRYFLKQVLCMGGVDAMLVQQRLPAGGSLMPVLVADPEKLAASPLAPVFPLNAARLVSKLSIRPSGGRIAVVLRTCEVRAFVELIKLKQGETGDLLVIGFDCPGAYGRKELSGLTDQELDRLTDRLCEGVLAGRDDPDLSAACRICEKVVPEYGDIRIGLLGSETGGIPLISATPAGKEVLRALDIPVSETPGEAGDERLARLVRKRTQERDRVFAETERKTGSLKGLADYFSECINCYNCRTVCPVCYCRECVFNTDTLEHDPFQYLTWAQNSGMVKMPADTLFFHLTRLAHMSTACVGCGQCSAACPREIPVMELFRSIARHTQKAFDYEAGGDISQPLPLSCFDEEA